MLWLRLTIYFLHSATKHGFIISTDTVCCMEIAEARSISDWEAMPYHRGYQSTQSFKNNNNAENHASNFRVNEWMIEVDLWNLNDKIYLNQFTWYVGQTITPHEGDLHPFRFISSLKVPNFSLIGGQDVRIVEQARVRNCILHTPQTDSGRFFCQSPKTLKKKFLISSSKLFHSFL